MIFICELLVASVFLYATVQPQISPAWNICNDCSTDCGISICEKYFLDIITDAFIKDTLINVDEIDYSESIHKLKKYLDTYKKAYLEKTGIDLTNAIYEKEWSNRQIKPILHFTPTQEQNEIDILIADLQLGPEKTPQEVIELLNAYFDTAEARVIMAEATCVPEPNSSYALAMEKIDLLQDKDLVAKIKYLAPRIITHHKRTWKRFIPTKKQEHRDPLIQYNSTTVSAILQYVNAYLKGTVTLENDVGYPLFDKKYNQSQSLYRGRDTLLAPPHNLFPAHGDRYAELYYWDTLFPVRGYTILGREDFVAPTLDYYFYMIDQYGFIPMASRQYYLARSQPPLFGEMILVLLHYYQHHNQTEKAKTFAMNALPRLLQEYFGFWMSPGAKRIVDVNATVENPLLPEHNTTAAIIQSILKSPNKCFFNRYYAGHVGPREEFWMDDTNVSENATTSTPELVVSGTFDNLVHSIHTAGEAGWDFSSRWCRKFVETGVQQELPQRQKSMEFFRDLDTISILPVDLNTILMGTLLAINELLDVVNLPESPTIKTIITQLYNARKNCVVNHMLDKETLLYYDFDHRKKIRSKVDTAAHIFAQAYTPDITSVVASPKVIGDYGVWPTPFLTHEEWDKPDLYFFLQGFLTETNNQTWAVKSADEKHPHLNKPHLRRFFERVYESVVNVTAGLPVKNNLFVIAGAQAGPELELGTPSPERFLVEYIVRLIDGLPKETTTNNTATL